MTPEVIAERLTLSKADKGVLAMLLVLGALVIVVIGYAIGVGVSSMVGDALRWLGW